MLHQQEMMLMTHCNSLAWAFMYFTKVQQRSEYAQQSAYLRVCGEQRRAGDIGHFLIVRLNDPVWAAQGIARAQRGDLHCTKQLLMSGKRKQNKKNVYTYVMCIRVMWCSLMWSETSVITLKLISWYVIANRENHADVIGFTQRRKVNSHRNVPLSASSPPTVLYWVQSLLPACCSTSSMTTLPLHLLKVQAAS